jgi:hypothetical protein
MMDLKKAEAKRDASRRGTMDSQPSYSKYTASSAFDQQGSGGGSRDDSYYAPSSVTPASSQGFNSGPSVSTPAVPMGGRGMQLGKKSTANSLLETLKAEDGGVKSSIAYQQEHQRQVPLKATSPVAATASQQLSAIDQEG